MTRLLGIIVHNWPLKLAAIGLATLLYGGLVLSQSTATLTGVVPVDVRDQPPDTQLLKTIRPVTEIRYFAPSGVRPIESDFEAWVDLSDVEPGTGPTQRPDPASVRRPARPRRRLRAPGRDRRARSDRPADRAGRGRARRRPDRHRGRHGDGRTGRGRGRRARLGHRPGRRRARRRDHPVVGHRRRPGRRARPDRQRRRRRGPGRSRSADRARHDPGLLRSPDADAAGQPADHRHAGGRVRDRVGRGRPDGVVTVEGDVDDLEALATIDTEPIPVTGLSTSRRPWPLRSRCRPGSWRSTSSRSTVTIGVRAVTETR